MSTQRIFDNIVNQFNSDDEEENEENESSNHSEEKKKHTKISSLNESNNNQIKEKLINSTNPEQNEEIKRDDLNDLTNEKENNDDNENEEKSETNENKKKEKKEDEEVENLSNNSQKENKEEEYDDNNNVNENNINNNEENYNDNNNNEEIQENENEQKDENDNINNEELIENEEIKAEEQTEEKEEEQKEENEIIDELYNKNKSDNVEQNEVELFRMGSFRPNPIPGSPKFSKRISKNTEINNENSKINNNNNNLTNFTETIETKIEEDKNNINQNKENNNYNPTYTHDNNAISLGKMPSFMVNNNSEISNNLICINNNNKVIEEHQDKNNEDIDKEEEDFLRREELKRKKTKEMYEEKNEIKNENNETNQKSNQKDEDEGKENVTEDEEENKNNNNIKTNNKNESGQIETKEDSKENNNENTSDKNSINNENNIKKNENKNYIDEMKVKDMSIKLLGKYQNAGNSVGDDFENSQKISSRKNNDINKNKTTKGKMNIYSKKKAPDGNNNKNSKKINNKITVYKRVIYDSPSNKNSGKNNANYSMDQSNNLSTNKNISSFNYNNSTFSKRINTQRGQDNIHKNGDNKSSSKKNNNKNSEEKFPFRPKINEKSRKIYEEQINNINKNINQQGQQKNATPLGLLMLYEDANITREKINQEYIRQNNNIINKANKKKINDNSYNMVNDRLNKKIDNAINKFQKNSQLNIINMTQCLYELNIINELIRPKDNMNESYINNQLDLSELQAMAESVKKKDIKKSEEIELIEQLWYLLNPKLEQSFNCEILSIFLKLFFCGNYTKKELEECIISLLENYKINDLEKPENYKSPLRNKNYNQKEIWPLSQFISVFLELKRNLKAYRENDYTKGDVYNNIIKEKDKNLTFEPKFISNKYFYKYSNFNYNKDNNSIIDLINKFNNKNPKQKHDFNKVYERFKAEKELHEKTLQKIREIQEEKELKMCTNVPKINKYRSPFKSPNKKKSNNKYNQIYDTEESLQKSKSFIKQPRYQLLYNLRKKYSKNENEERIDKDDILDENCTFKPKITDMETTRRTFSRSKNKKKPKGFNDYVKKNRALIEQKEIEKKLEEDKRYGRNYEKIQKMKIKPLNITFSNRSPSKTKRNISYINTDIKSKKDSILENEKNENIISDIYITLDIKVTDGFIRQLKIYNKSDKDTIEYISNFCKIYTLNEKIKKDLIKLGLKYKYDFFGQNIDNKREGSIPIGDIDTI